MDGVSYDLKYSKVNDLAIVINLSFNDINDKRLLKIIKITKRTVTLEDNTIWNYDGSKYGSKSIKWHGFEARNFKARLITNIDIYNKYVISKKIELEKYELRKKNIEYLIKTDWYKQSDEVIQELVDLIKKCNMMKILQE